MGVLGWTPDVVCSRASLRDLAEAYAEWTAQHAPAAEAAPNTTTPNPAALADFMQGMLARFPDAPQAGKKDNKKGNIK
ncbi:MAG TPA: hypothetical protein PLW48_10520 [Alphaproteobacteria bacterium]|nr:hypothetical protein [Rhodospirillaceae bacterium]HRJ67560.1 hypothetical protein [Alphaproteobacteria bacterium]